MMAGWKGFAERLKWYFTNLPVVSTAIFITIVICYSIKSDRNFSDVAVCVQPHMVLTGQVSRLIKYVVRHKSLYHLLLSIGSLAMFGTTAERQAGSFRFFWLTAIFSVFSAALTVFLSILLGFSSRYSTLMYSCPALGILPAMFGIMVLVFKSYPLKKTVFFFLMIPNTAMPWLLLIMSQIVLQDNMFIGNLCGCIVGSLYLWTSKSISILPVWIVRSTDTYLVKIFNVVPIIRYIPGASKELPVYNTEKVPASTDPDMQYQPEGFVVPIEENSVSAYKVNKLTQMGFPKEEGIVALAAANNNIEQAVSLLSKGQVGENAAVVPKES